MKSQAIRVRLDPELKAQFDSHLESQGLQGSKVIRRLLADYLVENGVSEASVSKPSSRHRSKTEPKWKVVNTRLTTPEWEVVEACLHEEQLSVTEWLAGVIAERVGRGPALREVEVQAMVAATYQLRSIGRNLNQMVRAMNEGTADKGDFTEKYAERLSNHVKDVAHSVELFMAKANDRWA